MQPENLLILSVLGGVFAIVGAAIMPGSRKNGLRETSFTIVGTIMLVSGLLGFLGPWLYLLFSKL